MAVRLACKEAVSKHYPLVDGDSGYGFGIVLAVLQKKPVRFQVGEGCTVSGCGDLDHVSDDQLRLAIGTSGKTLTLPAQEVIHVSAEQTTT